MKIQEAQGFSIRPMKKGDSGESRFMMAQMKGRLKMSRSVRRGAADRTIIAAVAAAAQVPCSSTFTYQLWQISLT